jgi:eukaryotic-like serine/threonine-protein kinase
VSDLSDRLRASLAGRYAIEKELGRGGMAVVYLARDERHDRLVAVKAMLPDVIGEDGAERFRREIHIAARLNHPNILTVFDSGDADGISFYVMPFVEGESLKDLVQRERQLGIADAVAIVRQVADALDYAHAEGVIHRDVKPANVLLTRTRTRTGRHAVVSDFGIARAMTGSGATRLTSTGFMVGTPSYMSPEQWGANAALDGRSDQYSLACVLYEMLIGEPPFTGATPMVVLARQSMEVVPSMRVARPGIPESLEQAINRAMAKVPGDRYPTVAAFADAVEQAAAAVTTDHVVRPAPPADARSAPTVDISSPPVATGASTGRLRARLGRRRMVIGAVAAIALAGLTGVALLSTRSESTQRTRLMVLPFEGRGATDDDQFADGLTEEIINRLSGVARLGVVARTSAMKYKGTTLAAPEIGREVNVDHLIEGNVTYRSGAQSAAHVSVRLVRASDSEVLWNSDFAVATLDDLYRAQTEIATNVVAKLAVRLDTDAERRLRERPTDNIRAYEAYQAGNQAFNRSWDSTDVKAAIAKYEEATRLDPSFALALASLGRAHGWMFQLGLDPTQARLIFAKQAIDSALRLAPDLPEARIALGLYYYWSARDYERALEQFRIVRRRLPSSADVYNYMGNVSRRKGDWRDAIESYRLAAELDPRAHQTLFNRAEALLYTRQYDEAAVLADRVIEIAPDFVDGFVLKATLQIQNLGDPATAARTLDETAARIPAERWRLLGHHWRAGLFRIVDRDLASAERRLVIGTFGLDSSHYFLAKAQVYGRIWKPPFGGTPSGGARTPGWVFRTRG